MISNMSKEETSSHKLCSPMDEEAPSEWMMSINGASNIKGSGFRIILERSSDILIEQTLKLEFTK